MALTETTLRGGGQQAHARRVRKWARASPLTPDGSELVAFVVKVDNLRDKTFHYVNKSASQSVTCKVYHCPDRTMPSAVSDANVKEIDSFSVGTSAMSEPRVFKGDYYWMIFTYNATADSSTDQAYFEGTKD